jgi:hypothetical protein
MRAPFAPFMSHGSRATQVKPEALVILFREKPLKPHSLCGLLMDCVYTHQVSRLFFHREIFLGAMDQSRATVHNGAEFALHAA